MRFVLTLSGHCFRLFRHLMKTDRGEPFYMKKICFMLAPLLLMVSCASSSARMPDVKEGDVSSDEKVQAEAYYHFMAGQRKDREGEFDAAVNEYEKAFRLDPRSAEVALSLSSLYIRGGGVEDAVVFAQKAAELAPDKTRALLLLAGIYSGRKRYDEAIDIYRKAIRIP